MVKDTIAGLGETIKNGFQSVLQYLFVPSNNLFDDLQQLFNEKFGVFNQISSFLDSIRFDDDDEVPEFTITVYGKTMSFISWELYQDYRPYIHNLIICIGTFKYILWVYKNASSIIDGTSNLSKKEDK